jgi:hypothetical protein
LYLIWLLLIVVLFFINWVGLRERYATNTFETVNVQAVGIGDVDVHKHGIEVIYMNPAGIYVVGGFTTNPWENTTFMNSRWDTDPLIGLTVGDFETSYKGDEIVSLSENGTLRLIFRGSETWNNQVIGTVPWTTPEWTFQTILSGQLVESSEAHEIVIIGEHFNWSTSTHSSHILVAEHVNNETWSLATVHSVPSRVLCGAIGDVDPSLTGQELIIGGLETNIIQIFFENGTWDNELVFEWVGTIRSLAIGNIRPDRPGNEIALVIGRDIRMLSQTPTGWDPDTIWPSSTLQMGIRQVLIADFDPFNPGEEVLGSGTVFADNRPVLILQSWNSVFWHSRILWYPIEIPETLATGNYDFAREGTELIVVNHPYSAVLAVPNITDRSIRAGQTVLLPALVLIPATMVTFGFADYLSRVSERRRRNRALEMVTKGFVKCPLCKRFVPKDKIEAHRRWHRTQQFR